MATFLGLIGKLVAAVSFFGAGSISMLLSYEPEMPECLKEEQ